MNHPSRRPAATSLATLVCALCAVGSTCASEVSFTGGFTSFDGPVATATGARQAAVETKINGEVVHADQPLPNQQALYDQYGIGRKTESLRDPGGDPIPTVNFSRIFFGGPNPNEITFTPVDPVDVSVGSVFKVGTFTVTNGSWFGNSPGDNLFPPTDFGFTVTTHSADARLNNFSFTDTLRFVVTSPSDPNATVLDDADYFYFLNHPALGTLSVLEATDPQGNPNPLGNTGSIDLMVKIGSLIPQSLANPTGAAFIGSQVAAVPEPGTEALMLAGLGALAWLGRARRKASRS